MCEKRETGSQETRSQETGSQETGSQETGSQETGSQETGSQEAGLVNRDSRDTVTRTEKRELCEFQRRVGCWSSYGDNRCKASVARS